MLTCMWDCNHTTTFLDAMHKLDGTSRAREGKSIGRLDFWECGRQFGRLEGLYTPYDIFDALVSCRETSIS